MTDTTTSPRTIAAPTLGRPGQWPRTGLLVGLIGLILTATLGWMTWDRISLLKNGREIVLAVTPVDPRSLFRGDYVILGYAITQVPAPPGQSPPARNGTPVYVTLEQEADHLSQRVDEHTVQLRLRHRRLRPELLRLTGRHARVTLLIVGLIEPSAATVSKLAAELPQHLRAPDEIVEVSDERLAVIVIAESEPGGLAAHLEEVSAAAREIVFAAGSAPPILTATTLPDDTTDVDDALMRVATAAVAARRRTRSGQ